MRKMRYGTDERMSAERRHALLTGAAGLVTMVVSPFICEASPSPSRESPSKAPAGTRLAYGTGACNQCAQEVYAGQRAAYQQCFLFNPAYEGSSVCQTCGHSWSYHA